MRLIWTSDARFKTFRLCVNLCCISSSCPIHLPREDTQPGKTFHTTSQSTVNVNIMKIFKSAIVHFARDENTQLSSPPATTTRRCMTMTWIHRARCFETCRPNCRMTMAWSPWSCSHHPHLSSNQSSNMGQGIFERIRRIAGLAVVATAGISCHTLMC